MAGWGGRRLRTRTPGRPPGPSHGMITGPAHTWWGMLKLQQTTDKVDRGDDGREEKEVEQEDKEVEDKE